MRPQPEGDFFDHNDQKTLHRAKATCRYPTMSIGIARKSAVLGLALLLTAAACGNDDGDTSAGGAAGANTTAQEGPSGSLKLGYFPNVTHAPAIIGVEEGIFADGLGDASLETFTFNSGTEASEALLSESI